MSVKLTMTVAYDVQDEKGWVVARVLGVPGAISQGRTREEARENVIDALRLMLAPGQEIAAHVRFPFYRIRLRTEGMAKAPNAGPSALPRTKCQTPRRACAFR